MAALLAYRTARKWTQADLARALGVSQAYVSQLERGGRPISRKLALKLARLPELPPAVVPPAHAELDAADADFAADLTALGYPLLAHRAESRQGDAPQVPRNPAAVLIAVLSREQVAPSVMAALPWVLLTYPDLDAGWLADQARRRNLQNRLGFLTDLALDVLRSRQLEQPGGVTNGEDNIAASIARLESLRADLETSRLANPGTLARVLTATEQQFFEEHRGAAARHWNLLTGMTRAQLPYR